MALRRTSLTQKLEEILFIDATTSGQRREKEKAGTPAGKPAYSRRFIGGRGWNRTTDPSRVKRMLYR
jgi:hypothetical protein